jgi:quercetin dioxygenase-like cupin family protein
MESETTDTVRIGGMELRFLVDETQGSGDLVMFEMTVLPNARVPVAHYHREVDEIVYGLSGALTTTVDGRKWIKDPLAIFADGAERGLVVEGDAHRGAGRAGERRPSASTRRSTPRAMSCCRGSSTRIIISTRR